MEEPLTLEFLRGHADIAPATLDAVIAAAIGVGTLYCFLGYRMLRAVIAILGFGLAALAASLVAAWLAPGNWPVLLVSVLVGGACGAFALHVLYKLGIFLIGALGAAIAFHLAQSGPAMGLSPWFLPLAALAGGGAALLLERPVVVFGTAVIGAWLAVAGVAFFALGEEGFEAVHTGDIATRERLVFLAVWVVLATAGVLTQFVTSRRRPPMRAPS